MDGVTLPKPLPRRGFTKRQRFMIASGQGWQCSFCFADIEAAPFEIDHIHPIWCLGDHAPSNWQALCIPCHKAKTKRDNREAKKGRRLRGELKPRPKRKIPAPPVSALSRESKNYRKRKWK